LAARLAAQNPSGDKPSLVHYLTAVDFARQYADSVAVDDLQALQIELDDIPILVVDDVHLMTDKAAAQEELAARIDRRCEIGLPTLIISRRLPTEIRGIRSRLASRSVGGLTVSIAPPAAAARTVLLTEFSLMHGVPIPPSLIELLSTGLPDDLTPRALEGCIKQISLWCRMNDQPIGTDAIQAGLDSVCRQNELAIGDISKAVARHFRLRSSDLKSSSRRQTIVRARSLAMYLSRRLTSRSLHQIGDAFGGRDHSTVLHAIRKTESLLAEDVDLRRAVSEVSEKLAS